MIIVTGCAGFIGYPSAKSSCPKHKIIGIDSGNEYYDLNLRNPGLRSFYQHLIFLSIKSIFAISSPWRRFLKVQTPK